ncbi:MAG: hypothetical protein MJ093_03530 [Saccharofermentans sp.]|nr:hypothetical protein [Saccharofermentans sp.]
MGFFSNIFGKKTCCLCGAECGVMGRTGIKNKEYVCSNCETKCSANCRISELDKAGVEDHIKLMEKQEAMYQKYFESAKKKIYPSGLDEQQIIFMDEIGMFTIRSKHDVKRKVNHEMFRYDTVDTYDYYLKTKKDDKGNDIFVEDGIKLRFVQPNNSGVATTATSGRMAHPYAKREVIVVFRKKEKDISYAENCIQYLDNIFGVHRNDTALFGGASAQKKSEFKAGADMLSAMASIAKTAAKNGVEDAVNQADLKAKMEQAIDSANDAQTMGLSKYTKAADAAEASV